MVLFTLHHRNLRMGRPLLASPRVNRLRLLFVYGTRLHCATAYGSKELFLFVRYPAFIPHPGGPGLGNMPGYFHSSLAGLECCCA
jgi:hypothetical protein